jgi:hypothetical protein
MNFKIPYFAAVLLVLGLGAWAVYAQVSRVDTPQCDKVCTLAKLANTSIAQCEQFQASQQAWRGYAISAFYEQPVTEQKAAKLPPFDIEAAKVALPDAKVGGSAVNCQAYVALPAPLASGQ